MRAAASGRVREGRKGGGLCVCEREGQEEIQAGGGRGHKRRKEKGGRRNKTRQGDPD